MPDDRNPFYLPFTLPPPQMKPRPNEKLWEVWAKNHKHYACELKYHGEFGVEAQIFEGGDLLVGRRFEARALAVTWALLEKQDIETRGFD
jgi:hypothetical protein